MRRRAFLTLLCGVAAATPGTVCAQAQGKFPKLGFLGAQTASAESEWTAAFANRLAELGWIDGRTIAIDYHWGNGSFENSAEVFAEFVHQKVDVIVTHATQNIVLAEQATKTIPIVFASAGDPVGNGLVVSLARPGGNVTGLSIQSPDTSGKRLGFLRDVFPALRRVAVFDDAKNPISVQEIKEVKVAARAFGVEAIPVKIEQDKDIAPSFENLKGNVDSLYVPTDPLFLTNRVRISTLALGARLPAIYGDPVYVEIGGLMAYGINWPAQFRRTAELVDKVLRGAAPADIPVEQPTKFDLLINLTTAKALGLTVPPTLLAIADKVIE
jgi:putative tryptophan/tyrosine transport system substrate-binding protein